MGRVRKATINVIDGRPVADPETDRILAEHGLQPDSVFFGELMTCLICGRQERSDPRVESGWRAMTVDGETTYYFCPSEFPPDGAWAPDYKLAYDRCLAALLVTRAGDPLPADVFAPIDWTGQDCADEQLDAPFDPGVPISETLPAALYPYCLDERIELAALELASRACRVCGCTEGQACPGGCYWVEADLCSRCAGKE